MFEFIRGPLVWIAFILFAGGVLYQIVTLRRLARKEKVAFKPLSKYGMRSVLHWIVPFGSRNMRLRPFFTVVSFGFHFSLLVTPIFAMGHLVWLEKSWGVSWWGLPPVLADLMTLVVVFACIFFILRRVMEPHVRYVSSWQDFLLALLVMGPFITGFVAHQQWLPYRGMITLHIISGALWLIAIPFTRLTHMLWFVLSRSFMGNEFGAVRKSRDW